ncbi:Nn.00g080830.m01.CDS01 [Neocucurbitaria sp. VM-36]
MPPRARANVLRGPGRPKKAVAPEPSPITMKSPPAKRGRPPKAVAVNLAAVIPKKRGWPSKAQDEEAAFLSEDVSPPKKRVGRPRKEDAPVDDAPALKKRGRPAKSTAPILSRVVGSPRVTKRSSLPPRSTPKAAATTPALRTDSRIPSRLRARHPPAPQVALEETAHQPAKRGRPRRSALGVTSPKPAAATRKASKTAVEKQAKPTKAAAPRKRRGYTVLEVPDKFAAQMKRFLQDLLDGNTLDPAPVEEVETEEGADIATEEDVLVTSAGANQEESLSGPDLEREKDDISDDQVSELGEETTQTEIAQAMAQDEDSEDEVPDETLVSVQEVEIEQDANGERVSFHQEVEELVVRNGGSNDPRSVFENEADDGLVVRKPLTSSAASIFG